MTFVITHFLTDSGPPFQSTEDEVTSQPPNRAMKEVAQTTGWHADALPITNGSLFRPQIQARLLMSSRKAGVWQFLTLSAITGTAVYVMYPFRCLGCGSRCSLRVERLLVHISRPFHQCTGFGKYAGAAENRRELQLNARHCPPTGPGDEMKAVQSLTETSVCSG